MIKLIPVQSPDGRLTAPLSIENDCSVGRGADCHVVIRDDSLSRTHCRIVFRQGAPFIEDAGSRNGTIVNKTRIAGAVELKSGDEIVIGKNIFRVELEKKESTAFFDSVGLADKKKETTAIHDSCKMAEDFDSQSPISLELDRRLLDSALQKEFHPECAKKPGFSLFRWFENKTHLTKAVLGAGSFLGTLTPEKLGGVPAVRNAVAAAFLLCMLTSYAIYFRLGVLDSGLPGVFLPSAQATVVFRAGVLGCLLFLAMIVLYGLFSWLGWRILKPSALGLKYKDLLRISLVAFVPACVLMAAGSLLAVLFEGTTRTFMECLRILGLILIAAGVPCFYYLLLTGAKAAAGESGRGKSGFALSFAAAALVTSLGFFLYLYNINSWMTLYAESLDWKTEYGIARKHLQDEDYPAAEKKLREIVRYEGKLSQEQKAETFFWLGVAQLSNGTQDGERNLKAGLFYASEAQKEVFFEVLDETGVELKGFDTESVREYLVVDGAQKNQDDVLAQLLLDAATFEGKLIDIRNVYYERFGFQAAKGFEGCDPWFKDPDTAILEPSELMQNKGFFFYFHPGDDDREARKFVMTHTGKSGKSFFVSSLKGRLARFSIDGTKVVSLFLVRSLTVNHETYRGVFPKKTIRSGAGQKAEEQ